MGTAQSSPAAQTSTDPLPSVLPRELELELELQDHPTPAPPDHLIPPSLLPSLITHPSIEPTWSTKLEALCSCVPESEWDRLTDELWEDILKIYNKNTGPLEGLVLQRKLELWRASF